MPTCRRPERYPCIGYQGSNPQTWALTLYKYVYIFGIGFIHEIIYIQQNYHLAWENININNDLAHSSIRNNPYCLHGHPPRQRSIQEAGLKSKTASFLFSRKFWWIWWRENFTTTGFLGIYMDLCTWHLCLLHLIDEVGKLQMHRYCTNQLFL